MIKEYELNDFDIAEVAAIEKEVFVRFEELINDVRADFAVHNCEIEIGECWTMGNSRALSARPPLGKDYIYWVCYMVQKNGKSVVCDDENSVMEEGYGAVSVTYQKGCLFRKRKVLVSVCSDMDDVQEDLRENLRMVIDLYT